MAAFRAGRPPSGSVSLRPARSAGFANGAIRGATGAKPQGGDQRSRRIEVYREVILAAIEQQVDITLVEMVEMLWAEHGAVFAARTSSRFLDRHAMTLKKTAHANEQERPTSTRGNTPGSTRSLTSIPNGW